MDEEDIVVPAWAKIDMTFSPGYVENIQVVNPGDYLDPTFTWVDVTNLDPQPFTGCAYDGTNFTTYIAAPFLGSIPSDIPRGEETTFDPFVLSVASGNFNVTINGNIISIGCQNYDYVWLRYAIYTMNTQSVVNMGVFTKVDIGVSHNNFIILQADVDLVYAALCTLL